MISTVLTVKERLKLSKYFPLNFQTLLQLLWFGKRLLKIFNIFLYIM